MSTPSRLPRVALLACGALLALATTATVATSTDWPRRLPLHLALFVGAGLLWAATLALLSRIPRRPRDRAVVWAVALALRLPAWLAPTAHSDDANRFAWDGRVTLAGINPYRFAPSAPELAALRGGALFDPPGLERAAARPTVRSGPLWARVNNPDLPTIYPPVAQLGFALAALLPVTPLGGLKILFALADLGVLVGVLHLLARRGSDTRFAIAWAWSPLVAIEFGQNAHLDALPLAAVVAALVLAESRRWWWAGALLGAAAGAKLFAAPLLVAFRSWRAWLAAVAVLGLTALPFLGAGRAIVGSTGEFARRWRSNDGLYALVQAISERTVCRALAPPTPSGPPETCTRPLDLTAHPGLARFMSGRTYRATVFQDELSSFCARAVIALLFGLVCLFALFRARTPLEGTEWIFGALLLLTPTLQPWYATWILPIAALTRRPAWFALAALVPLGYAPMAAWLDGEPWRDPIWTRALEHGACLALLAAGAIRARLAPKIFDGPSS